MLTDPNKMGLKAMRANNDSIRFSLFSNQAENTVLIILADILRIYN